MKTVNNVAKSVTKFSNIHRAGASEWDLKLFFESFDL